jgi:bifunctional enzyme CysN/CysC
VTPLTGSHGAGRSVGITLDRELFIERGDVIAHAGATPRDTRRIRARIFWLHDKPLSKGDQILIRLGTRESRASVVAIEKAVDPGELSNEETKAIARNHCRRNRHLAGAADRGRSLLRTIRAPDGW